MTSPRGSKRELLREKNLRRKARLAEAWSHNTPKTPPVPKVSLLRSIIQCITGKRRRPEEVDNARPAKRLRLAQKTGIAKLPPELCLEILSHCDWSCVKNLSYVNRYWNNIASDRLFQNLFIPAEDVSLDEDQRRKVQKVTTGLTIGFGMRTNSQKQALDVIQLLNFSKCRRLILDPESHPIGHKQYEAMLRAVKQMPRLMDVDLPAVYSARWGQPLASKLTNLEATLCLELDHNRTLTIGLFAEKKAGTPYDAVFQVCGQSIGDLRLRKLSLSFNGEIQVGQMRMFGSRLGFNPVHRADMMTSLVLVDTVLWGDETQLSFLGVHKLKQLALHHCTNSIVLLRYIRIQALLSNLELEQISIIATWDSQLTSRGTSTHMLHEEELSHIWLRSPRMWYFKYQSDFNLTRRFWRRVLSYRGHDVRHITYRVRYNVDFYGTGNSLDMGLIDLIYDHCPNIQSMVFDVPNLPNNLFNCFALAIGMVFQPIAELGEFRRVRQLRSLRSLHFCCRIEPSWPITFNHKQTTSTVGGCMAEMTKELDVALRKHHGMSGTVLQEVSWTINHWEGDKDDYICNDYFRFEREKKSAKTIVLKRRTNHKFEGWSQWWRKEQEDDKSATPAPVWMGRLNSRLS